MSKMSSGRGSDRGRKVEKGISDVKAYELVREAVLYYWCKRFYSLGDNGDDVEDMINDIYLVLYRRGLFRKWKPGRASKKTYVSVAVKNAMIDKLKTFKERQYLYEKDTNGEYFISTLIDRGYDDNYKENRIYEIIEDLPDKSRWEGCKGNTPLGKKPLSLKTVALLLMLGYSVKMVSEMFDSPFSDGNVSLPIIYEMRDRIKNIFINSGYEVLNS